MKKHLFLVALALSIGSISQVQACPFTLSNDTAHLKIHITDRFNGLDIQEKDVRNPIAANSQGTIGDHAHRLTYVYVQRPMKNGDTDYALMYRLEERYCIRPNKFSYSDITKINEKFAGNPKGMRFKITSY